jgi:hypothetical protein
MLKKIAAVISSQKGNGLPVMLAAVAVVIAAAGFGVYQYDSHKVPASHAAQGNQWCTNGEYTCLNAWDGGPYVKTYFNGASHNDFYVGSAGNLTYYIEYVGGSGGVGWWGHCIGDAENNSAYKTVSLDVCPGVGRDAGWGTVFSIVACHTPDGVAGFAFKNAHWTSSLGRAAYLHPQGDATRKNIPYMLDGTSAYCFGKYGPA